MIVASVTVVIGGAICDTGPCSRGLPVLDRSGGPREVLGGCVRRRNSNRLFTLGRTAFLPRGCVGAYNARTWR